MNNGNEVSASGNGSAAAPSAPIAGPTPSAPIAGPMPEPMPQQLPSNQPVGPDTNASGTKTKNKKNLIIGCSIGGAVLLILIVVILVIVLMQGSKKVVSCTTKMDALGVNISSINEVEVGDGKLLGGELDTTVDLKSLGSLYQDNEEEFVNSMVSSANESCKEHCAVAQSDYVKGDYLRIVLSYDGEGISDATSMTNIEGKKVQEIADMIKQQAEQNDSTTCVIK